MEAIQKLDKNIFPSRLWVINGALLRVVSERGEGEQLAIKVPHILNISLSQFEYRFRKLPSNALC
jgi:hypothetical protein